MSPMRRQSSFWSLLFSILLVTTPSVLGYPTRPTKRNHDAHDYYVVEHRPSAGARLDEILQVLGVDVVERVGELDGVWLVRAPKNEVGDTSDRVLDAYQDLQTNARLSSRSNHSTSRIVSSIAHLSKQHLRELEKRAPPPISRPPTIQSMQDKYDIADPFFPLQWHLANDRFPEHMMNVTPVWDLGYTGKGVITSLIDDGLDYTSDDLKANFDAANSYDFNDHVPLPYPKNEKDHHGTRCAGQIAAGKNKACGVGIAYNSKVAGLRILSGKITTVDEAVALNYGFQNVSIYSCSWGPRDDGTRMQAPPYLVQKAVLNGINKGRGGKGSIFVFASGNGAHKGDQCNFDGYTNSIYSVTVGSVDYKGLHPKYSEPCAANLVVAYSSGSGEHIVTTDKGKDKCALTHGGTSAAAPNVAGVIALALEARPDLTWRDVQHLIRLTARRVNPSDRDWERTSTGHYYSYKFGYGVMDASLFVQAALTWKSVPPQTWIETETVQLEGGAMDESGEFDGGAEIGREGVKSKIRVTPQMVKDGNLATKTGPKGDECGVEHVTVKVWIDHTRRGDVGVVLISPNGVRSVLAVSRERDEDPNGFRAWTFMSVKHWGENPIGDWTIHVTDQQSKIESGAFLGWNMVIWGAAADASKAKLYEMPDELEAQLLPPPTKGGSWRPSPMTPERPVIPGHDGDKPTKTNDHVIEGKPTADLPHEPSGSDGTGKDNSKTGDDSGWMQALKDKASKQTWLVVTVAVLILANILGATYYCCFRRRANRGDDGGSGSYNALPGEENVPLSNLGGGVEGGVRARGYADDDDFEGGEGTAVGGVDRGGTGLQGGGGAVQGPHAQARSTGGIGFHSGFLDDDPLTAATARYKDGALASPPLSSAAPAPTPVGDLISTADVTTATATAVQPRAEQEVSSEEDDDDDDDDDEDDDEDEDEESEEESSEEEVGRQAQRRPPTTNLNTSDSSASLI